MSEQEIAPCRVLWDNLKLIIKELADDDWRDVPEDSQWKLNQLAIRVHAAVEKQLAAKREAELVRRCIAGDVWLV